MKHEELIKKWLDNDLSPEESKAFEALDDYQELIKLSDNVKRFEAPEFNKEVALNAVLQKIHSPEITRKTRWTTHVMRIAAVLAISLSVYYFSTTLNTNISTLAAQKTTIELPDNSQVTLNAGSSLSFNESKWSNARDVALEGEAFFKVAKGESFNVMTADGKVTVLGTEFNVKQRSGLFEVICYEGSVEVTHETDQKILKAGDSFLLLDGKIIAKEKETALGPSWINNESYFKSMPFAHVIHEFERQYNVTIETDNIDLDQLFTGSFAHNEQSLALKSITLPLNLKYSKKDNSTIVLTRE
ncbi:MAG: FecR domain-containing protein [Bacteroidia bacterium]|nr:FecR domain-containing protein [Bacteroidia bacterium]